jgi:hypothetical protein
LLSATARSVVYLVALAHSGLHGGLFIVVVEMAYVTLTAGLYAGLQQKALGFRSRLLGNLTVVLGVPALSQILDLLAHGAAGATVPGKAAVAVSVFAAISAMFHLYVMRRGTFLTGERGRTLLEDFLSIPRLIADLVMKPLWILESLKSRQGRIAQSEPAL